tara:strand:+ start:229 stop:495 length:267 start_codon:yes stop_codon:yes gene_type:complete
MVNQPKYRVGQRVLIDKVFSTKNNAQGCMEKLDETRVAIIVHVEPRTSLGPCYKIKWDDLTLEESRIRYWETDISGPENKENKRTQEA